jgi:cysteine desulfurase
MRIYLDNNATTQIHPSVLDRLAEALRDVYGNASSIHQEGQRARQLLEESRERVAALLGASTPEIVFTSGGTESNNAAIHGAVLSATPHRHIVTSTIEHPSVLEPVRQLVSRGYEASFVRPAGDGQVSAEALISAVRPDTALVTLMLANNETGVVQPVEEVGRFCRERGIHFHCDAVQGAGKTAVDVTALNADSLALSGHKIHAPKGVGALYVRRGVVLSPHLSGGFQERRRRAGTENVPLAAAFAVAADLAADAPLAEMAARRDALEALLTSSLPDCVIHGRGAARVPNTANVAFPGVDAEGLVISLDLHGVAVSTGSACSSGRTEPSHVLLEMGYSEDHARSSIRFSLSRFTTDQEVARAASLAAELAPRHRRRSTTTAS